MLIAAGALESAAEKLGEQMVITEPVAVDVEAAQEKIPLFDLLEQLPAGRVGKDPARSPLIRSGTAVTIRKSRSSVEEER
ncbi:hypothetical protein [Rhodococcus sp. IEGM 1307]|uniref:hypothetical protein n=1 Tax=Rhodococcus sp. IEGM 1307 TaxID=3047091 RepID=UPI0024B817D6|nr:MULTISPECIES: hypothetical protein [unclassified Rhodococcus (in: high G+C Gram-positive bacteria)]MDI9949417.1 hypothetical protein [Rhodococcus sp. IEGM 1305]MDI9975833.1 hypothetical protein [Rhodococcus sp. IEGM 1307]